MEIRTSSSMVCVTEKVGDIDISATPRPEPGRIELHLDSDEAVGILRVRVFASTKELIIERLVRSLPGSLSFPAPQCGRYDVVVTPLRSDSGAQACKSLTWSDWGDMMGGGAGSGGAQSLQLAHATGAAVLKVA